MLNVKNFPKGSIIIQENDIGEDIFLLKTGRVEVYTGVGSTKVVYSELGPNQIFGEMSVIDEKPRSASVRALEDCVVTILHRDDFLDVLAHDKELASLILSNLFARLRSANTTRHTKPQSKSTNVQTTLTLVGMTIQARRILPQNPFKISKFPFVIGRQTRDPLAKQDLAIPDGQPYQISRHHVMFDQDEDGFFLQDMGSHLGSSVNNRRIGGRSPDHDCSLSNGDIVTFGQQHSIYRFRVEIS